MLAKKPNAKSVVDGKLDVTQSRSAEQGNAVNLKGEGSFHLQDEGCFRNNDTEHAFHVQAVAVIANEDLSFAVEDEVELRTIQRAIKLRRAASSLSERGS